MFVQIAVAPADWPDVSVRVGAQALAVSLRMFDGEPVAVADWPRSGPGSYRVDVTIAGVPTSETFTIEPSKMSSEDFGQLITSLESELPTSIAIALKQLGGLVGVDVAPPRPHALAEEVARIRRVLYGDATMPGLVRLLVDISSAPHAVFRTTDPWVKRAAARRPAAARLASAYARAGNLDRDGTPLNLVDSRVQHSFDTYENRIVATFIQQIDARIRRLERVATVGTLLSRDEIAALRDTLVRARRTAPFLDEVRTLRAAPTQITMVLLRRPPYRAVFAAYLAFQRGLAVRIRDSALSAPLEDLPYLYQMWGTLRVILALLETAAPFGFRVEAERLIGRDHSGLFFRVLPAGRVAVRLVRDRDGREVRLIPEPTYGRRGTASQRIYSVSFDQRPDVAVEIVGADGRRDVYLFDPKYKLTETSAGISVPTKIDIDKMHAYRDAIRGGDGRRLVRYAGTLYPGPTVKYGHGISALQALPSTVAELHAELRQLLGDAISVKY